MASSSSSAPQRPGMVEATTADGQKVTLNASDLRFSLGKPVDEETFRKRFARQGIDQAPNVITIQDLNRLKLRYKLQQMQAARKSNKSVAAADDSNNNNNNNNHNAVASSDEVAAEEQKEVVVVG